MILGFHARRRWAGWPVAATVFAVFLRVEGAQLLPNPGFEAPYNAVNVTNSHAYISGQLASTWSDNSSWTNTLLAYSQETGDVHGGGSALRVDVQDYPGYTNGALVQLYRSFNMAKGRPYQASVWVRSSTNASVQLIIRQEVSPYKIYFSVTNAVSTNWQQMSVASVGPTNVTARFQLYTRSLCSLWFDDASLTTPATNLYVDPAGSDTNSGMGIDQPLQTLQRAASAAVAGDTVFIRGGTYRETVTPANSGTPDAPIVFQPYAGETVMVSGTENVSTNGWIVHSGSIFRAPVGWTMGLGNDQVFVDGQMMTEARWPNTGLDPSRPTLASVDSASYATNQLTNAVGTINDAALTAAANSWTGGWINLGIGPVWVVGSYPILSNTTGQLKFGFKYSSSTYVPQANNPYVLWGKLDALDTAGEWFNDTNAATLYLWTPAGDAPASHAVEVKRRANAFDFSGRSNIVVRGIKLFAATVLTSSSSRGITLDGIEARFPSHFSYISSGWSAGFGNSGIVLNGSDHVIRDSDISWSAGNGVALLGTNHAVVNCAIHDVDYAATDCGGVVTSSSPYGHVVSSNTIFNSGRGLIVHRGLRAGWIGHNHLYVAGLQMQDLGATYCFGTDGDGTEIAYNYIHDIAPKLASKIGCGIYLDNGSQNHTVHHNVAFRVSNSALRLNTPCTNEIAYCNTLGGGTDSVNYWPGTNVMIGTIFINNIFTNTVLVRTNETVLSNNLYKTNNPQFVNAAAGDFRLQAGSPAIDAGAVVPPYTDGYAGVAPDIGAYESGMPPWQAGAVLRASDIAGLSVTFTNFSANATASGVITNFPPGRIAPAAMTLRLGTNLAGVANGYNTNTHLNRGGFTIGTHGVSGSQPVFVSLDGVNYETTGSSVTFPAVTITSPVSGATWMTTNASLDIAGTATADGAVAQVTWANDRGGSGVALGAENWAATGIALQAGTNLLTVTAADSVGREGSAALSVIRGASPVLTNAVSRKTHGAAGAFDLGLALDAGTNATVEPRFGGPTLLMFAFTTNVVAADGALDASEFTLTNATYAGAAISNATLALQLTNVADRSLVTVALNGLTDPYGIPMSGTNSVRIRALYGDVNQSGSVSVSDMQYVKNRLLQPVGPSNFLADLNLTGAISVSDMQAVKNNLLHTVIYGGFSPITPPLQLSSAPVFVQPPATLGEAVSAPALTWTTNGDELWAPTVTEDALPAARTGVIGDYQVSWIETTVMGPGTVSFEWRASSELNGDFVAFSVDGVEQPGRLSGETGWQPASFTLAAGERRLRWTYGKDGASSVGADAAWLRRMVYTRSP